jgi:hypothetical protein
MNDNQERVNDSRKIEKRHSDIKSHLFFTWLIDQGIPVKMVTCLYGAWLFLWNVLNSIYRIGIIIITAILEFFKHNPNMCTGLVVGLALSWLLDQIPILGWFIGPFVTFILTVFCVYKGHLFDKPDGNVYTAFNEYLQVIVNTVTAIKDELTQRRTAEEKEGEL